MNAHALRLMLIKHEGIKLKPYFDCCGKFFRDCVCEKQGKLTIGIGRNIEDVGISVDESMTLLDHDISTHALEASQKFPWVNTLSDNRQNVIVSMLFNMGYDRVLGFKQMITAIKIQDWNKAASCMLASMWASKVGQRAVELAELMRVG